MTARPRTAFKHLLRSATLSRAKRTGALREAEIDRQVLSGIVEVERHTTIANLLCWGLVAAAASVLPFGSAFILPLLLRLGIMANTKVSFGAMRRKLASGGDYAHEFHRLLIALALGGVAWGATLVPLLIFTDPHPARLLAGGGTFIGMAIIASLLSPNLKMALAFNGGVAAALAAGLLWTNTQANDVIALAALLGLCSIFLAYARATAVGQRRSAELFVENVKIGKVLAEALERMTFLAERDPLTSLYNRRALFDLAGRLTDYRIRHVLLLDLDHFKAINDRHGHATGDEVLVHAGRALRAVAESLDEGQVVAARIGGEEFALVIDSDDAALVRTTAESLRHALRLIASRVSPGDTTLHTSVSIGIAEWIPDDDLGTAISRADAALYRAKQAGRDRVVVADKDAVAAVTPAHRVRTARR